MFFLQPLGRWVGVAIYKYGETLMKFFLKTYKNNM